MATQLSQAEYYKIDGQLAEIKRQMRQESGYPYSEARLIQHLQNAIEGRFADPKVPHLFTFLYPLHIEAVQFHNMKDCFKRSKGIWLDRGFEHRTRKDRRAHTGGAYQVSELTKDATFPEMARAILGVGVEVGDAELQRLLIQGCHCVEMLQIKRQIERFYAGEKNTGLTKDRKHTYFFVRNYDGTEEKDFKNETVSVVLVHWPVVPSEWRVVVCLFYREVSSSPGSRILSRNLKAPTL